MNEPIEQQMTHCCRRGCLANREGRFETCPVCGSREVNWYLAWVCPTCGRHFDRDDLAAECCWDEEVQGDGRTDTE